MSKPDWLCWEGFRCLSLHSAFSSISSAPFRNTLNLCVLSFSREGSSEHEVWEFPTCLHCGKLLKSVFIFLSAFHLPKFVDSSLSPPLSFSSVLSLLFNAPPLFSPWHFIGISDKNTGDGCVQSLLIIIYVNYLYLYKFVWSENLPIIFMSSVSVTIATYFSGALRPLALKCLVMKNSSLPPVTTLPFCRKFSSILLMLLNITFSQ